MLRKRLTPSGRCLTAIVVAALATGAPAGTITPLVVSGDDVPGVGLVTRVDNVVVNDHGSWIVEARTDNADPAADTVLLLDGLPLLREGQALDQPAGATIKYFTTLTLNAAGDSVWNFGLSGVPFGQDTGLFFGDQLLIQAGDPSAAPEFSPGTRYFSFAETKYNDAGVALVMATVDDPQIISSTDQALLLVTYDDVSGEVVEQVVAKEGDLLAGQVRLLATFQTTPHTFDVNAGGVPIFTVDLAGTGPDDTAVYRGEVALAQEGSPSPLGVVWAAFTNGTRTAIGSATYAILGKVGTADPAIDTLLVRNGAKFVQEGDTVPQGGGFRLTGFGTGPIVLSDDGALLWFGQWDDPDASVDSGLFLERTLVVQEGVTTVGDVVIDEIGAIQDAYDMSPNGRFVIFQATLADGRLGAFLLDLDGTSCAADIDGSGVVGPADLAAVLSAWGRCASGAPCPADVDGSGAVDFGDVLGVISNWGPCP